MGLQHEIKRRVTFTKNIKRILESLKMIAAMRSKKMFVAYNHALKFRKNIEKTYISTMHSNILAEEVLYIVIGATKGLCGSFTINLNMMLKTKFPNIEKKTHTKWIILGNKLPNYLKNIKEEDILLKNTDLSNDQIYLMRITELIYKYRESFKKIVFLSWNVQDNEPTEQIAFDLNNTDQDILSNTNIINMEDNNQQLENIYIKNLVILHLFSELNLNITGSIAREEKIRLLSMDQAITNSDDMLLTLQRKFNQVRQASITNEINEIISGAEFA